MGHVGRQKIRIWKKSEVKEEDKKEDEQKPLAGGLFGSNNSGFGKSSESAPQKGIFGKPLGEKAE